MVGQPHGEMEREIHPQEGDRYGNRLRCIPHRVGCSMPEPTDRRSMVSNRMSDAYKLPRTAGSYICNTHIPEKQKQGVSPPESGQHYNCGIHQQSGRHSLQGLGGLGQESMDVVPGTEHPHHSATPARCAKRDCRCGVTDNEGSIRLATEPCPVQQDCQALGSNSNGPICISTDHSVPTLFQLAARSLRSGNKCLPAGLVSYTGLCQPTLEYDREGSVTGQNPTGMHCASGTSLEDTAMVPSAATHAGSSTTSDSTQSDSTEQGPNESNPTTSRVAYLRERYRSQELSDEATSLMLKSWRTKTNRSYDSLFRKWHSWCHTRGSDPFSGPVNEVVNFLANLYKEGYQYRSLDSYRSAISSVHERTDG